MTKLALGVLDGLHPNEDSGVKTIAEVAQALEDEYHLIRNFYKMHEQDIRDQVMKEFMRTLRTGEEFTAKRTSQKVESLFRAYLDKEEHGIKTRAAQLGISHRHKSGKMSGQRESFIDTGTYRGSFRVWIA